MDEACPNRINDEHMAEEMAYAMKREMDDAVMLDFKRQQLEITSMEIAQLVMTSCSLHNSRYFEGNLKNACGILKNSVDDLRRSAELSGRYAAESYLLKQEVADQEASLGGVDEIKRYLVVDDASNPLPWDRETDGNKKKMIKTAAHNKQKIRDLLELTGSNKTIEELSDDDIRKMIKAIRS